MPQSLEKDSGDYLRDINSALRPEFPVEPAVRAILHEKSKDPLLESDLFACGSTLGCLLSVARDEERSFRFGVERVGSTTFFVRKTNTPGETIDGVRGYGHTFPAAYTVWETPVSDSVSHQRIIQYDFMGLKIILRSKCDGYLPHKLPGPEPQDHSTASDTEPLPAPKSDVDDHFNISAQSNGLDIITAGRAVPQHAIFDLKTRSNKVRDRVLHNREELCPPLWANQTPNLVLAFHDDGTFNKADILLKDVKGEVREWEIRNSVNLERLGWLLRKLIDISKTPDTARFEVRRTGYGSLEIWTENPGWSALPKDLKVELGSPQDDSNDDRMDQDDDADEEGRVYFSKNSVSEDEKEDCDADYIKFEM